MNVRILYQAQYAYETSVTFSRHLFRLFPKAERHVRVRRLDFTTNLDANVSYRRDLFDNEIASCFYPTPSALLTASFHIELEIEERNAFGFLLDAHALKMPLTYEPHERAVLAPYLSILPPLEIPFWKLPSEPQPTVELLVDLNCALHDNIAYERREEGVARPAAETLALRRGACRDMAVLLADALRGMGLAARLASGYLCEFGASEKVAEGALHAWVETYLPGAGWFGMDPTNGTLCDHHHLAAAVGLTPEDIAPVLGSYYHPTRVEHQLNAQLQVLPHA